MIVWLRVPTIVDHNPEPFYFDQYKTTQYFCFADVGSPLHVDGGVHGEEADKEGGGGGNDSGSDQWEGGNQPEGYGQCYDESKKTIAVILELLIKYSSAYGMIIENI